MPRKLMIGGLCAALGLFAAGDSRLSEATMRGEREVARKLLAQKADVNGAQGDGSTALHWAAFHEDLDLVKTLLAAGAKVDAATREGAITPLFMACTHSNAAVIEALLNAGAGVNSAKANGTTPLMTAAAAGGLDAVRVLLAHGAQVNAKESAHGQTALMFAAALNRDAVVRLLLAKGAETNVSTAVQKVARVRFDQDGNVVEDRPAPQGAPAAKVATAAAQDARDEAADAKAAADAAKTANEIASAELNTLAHALGLQSARYTLGKPRVRAGDVAARAPRRVGPEFTGAMTALLYAAREGHAETVRALLEGGADINQQNADKFTPLVMAITNG
ncbi:MAG TPA: ankyrin repeat domain-containing protein, partial [Candidatus Solibacter sp.]